MARIAERIENSGHPEYCVKTATNDTYLAEEFLLKALGRVFITDCSRFEYPPIPVIDNLKRIEKIVDVRRKEGRIELPPNSVDSAVAPHYRLEDGFLFFHPSFKLPI